MYLDRKTSPNSARSFADMKPEVRAATIHQESAGIGGDGWNKPWLVEGLPSAGNMSTVRLLCHGLII